VTFFWNASLAFHHLELSESVPAPLRAELRTQYRQLQQMLPDSDGPVDWLAQLGRRQQAPSRFATVSNHWVIVYNWRTARFERWSELGTDVDDAASEYANFERQFPPSQGFEVVLVGADSIDTIQRTHAHYFGRTPNDIDPHGVFREII
jgi:hypothetical protein